MDDRVICRRQIRYVAMRAIVAATVACVAGAAVAAPDFSGQTIDGANFSLQDLTGANFTNATIVGGNFVRATLKGARFDGATFKGVAGHPTHLTDFTQADLSNATFTNAKFESPTYFTYATLTCADFSNTVLNNGNAVFGDEALIYAKPINAGDCRVKFRSATMSCEFIDDWRNFDLTGANVAACFAKLSGRNFSGAILDGVNLDNAILDGADLSNASLIQASLRGASLQCLQLSQGNPPQCVDASNAQLQGAHLDNANLTGASLLAAVLTNNGNNVGSATLTQAHLKNVNLAGASLSGADFTFANFYGENPVDPGGCGFKGNFTNACASAKGATMTGTKFIDAYLYGVDFSGKTTILGVDFQNAVLVAANFNGATIGVSPVSGASTSFRASYMQGTNLDKAISTSTYDLSDAFFDFPANGNRVFVNLGGATHNAFACGTPSTCQPASGQNVCVNAPYGPTTVPATSALITCPNRSSGPCGVPGSTGSNPPWKSPLSIGDPAVGNDPPPLGWYYEAATFTPPADPSVVCDNKGTGGVVRQW